MDLSQFLTPFFDECFERLQQMEIDLRELEAGSPSANRGELIESLFRGAHSIKGGAGTFGLGQVANHARQLEELLGAMASGKQELAPDVVQALREAVGALRDLLVAEQDGSAVDQDAVGRTFARIARLLEGDEVAGGRSPVVDEGFSEAGHAEASEVADPLPPSAAHRSLTTPGWHIRFRPAGDLAAQGGEPLRILRELARLGRLQLGTLDEGGAQEPPSPGWAIDLLADVPRERVEDVFAWVMDQAEVAIEPISPVAEGGSAPVTPQPTPEVAVGRGERDMSEGGPVPGALEDRRGMAAGLDRLVQELAGPLREAAESVQSFTSEVRAGLARHAEGQAGTLAGLTSDLTGLGVAVARQAAELASVGDAAGEACQRLETGNVAVGEAVRRTDLMRQDVLAIGQVLGGLEDAALQVGLLRVHVAVEAARLGETQGQALAGIARELRALAERSSSQLAEGRTIIRTLQARLDDEGRLLLQAGTLFDELVGEVRLMREDIARLAGAAETQAGHAEAAVMGMAGLEGEGRQQAAWLDEAAGTARRIEAQAEGLRRIVQGLAGTAEG